LLLLLLSLLWLWRPKHVLRQKHLLQMLLYGRL
jgi:hypothetical protein